MIITLKGANFSGNNIGTLDMWFVNLDLTGITSSNTSTSVKKGEAWTTTFTIKEGYKIDENSSFTVDGVTQALTWSSAEAGGTASFSFTPTKNTSIVLKATSTGSSGGEEEEPDVPENNYEFNFNFTEGTINDYALQGIFTVPENATVDAIEYDSIKGMSLNNNFKALPLVTPLDAGKSWEIEIVGTFITPTDLTLNRRGFISSGNTNPFVFFNGSTASQMTFQFGYGSSKNFYLASGKIQFDKETTWKCVYDSETTTFTLYQDGVEIGTATNTTYSLTGQNFTAILGNAGSSSAYIWKNEEGKKSYLKKFSFRYI